MFRLFLFLYLVCQQLPLISTESYIVYRGHYAGMFSSFMMVIGLLDGYDRGDFAGIEVALNKSEIYFDGAYGSNWWEYYFSPIRMKKPHHAHCMELSKKLSERIALRGHKTLSRERCHELIMKYISIKPAILRELDDFLKNFAPEEKLIGVHYRGTDKFAIESNYISPEKVCLKIEEVLQKFPKDSVKIFVATDSEDFLNLAGKRFGKKVYFFGMKRSQNGSPIHTNWAVRGYTRGKLALLDCLALSRCDILIRTSSNLSNVSMLFNPNLPVIRLNNSNWGLDR